MFRSGPHKSVQASRLSEHDERTTINLVKAVRDKLARSGTLSADASAAKTMIDE